MNRTIQILMVATILLSAGNVSANKNVYTEGTPTVVVELPFPHKCPKPNSTPKVSYNSKSTVLNVSFPATSQGGKVEIYRNGVKVVNTSAPARASLSFVLSNYGKGDYTVIVSCGNTVVYSNYVTVK